MAAFRFHCQLRYERCGNRYWLEKNNFHVSSYPLYPSDLFLSLNWMRRDWYASSFCVIATTLEKIDFNVEQKLINYMRYIVDMIMFILN